MTKWKLRKVIGPRPGSQDPVDPELEPRAALTRASPLQVATCTFKGPATSSMSSMSYFINTKKMS